MTLVDIVLLVWLSLGSIFNFVMMLVFMSAIGMLDQNDTKLLKRVENLERR